MILPILTAWLINPAAHTTTNPALLSILPEVHAVHSDGQYLYVESAGLSLQSLGSITANDREPAAGARKFVYRFPLQPTPANDDGTRTPVGVVGAFLNGVPLYNPVSPASYQDQNIWHLDAVASLSRQARTQPLLLESLFSANGRHSPLIGFAFDGYPIYGPYGWDQQGKVIRLRSSYRLRAITRRAALPDGTELTPSQEGPPVNAEYPLGTFSEDYEYASGAGDLDEHNGRWTKTPEYPQGTYAYFLSTYPYLVGPTYFGRIEPEKTSDPAQNIPIDFAVPGPLVAGRPATLRLTIRDDSGRKIRFLERIHEQPIHLLVVSTDLVDFAHIHPELQPDDTYSVSYSFPHGGSYWIYADYTRPGKAQSISRFELIVPGQSQKPETLHPDTVFSKIQDGLQVKLTLPSEMHAGQDLTFRFDVPVDDLDPYLGAWAHIMIVSEDGREFIHAHPQDAVGPHTHAVPGPSPSTIQTTTGFRKPGLYRLWVQFQRQGKVITIPYTLKVEPAKKRALPVAKVPEDAIRIRVSSNGFEPARLKLASAKPIVLAFDRQDAQNCANTVDFPELGIRESLPAGEVVLIAIPAAGPRELHFTCGMNMYRGSLVIR
jgi:hypothetical protein